MLDKVLAIPDLSSKIVVICGPTASGKSQLALDLAKKIGGIVVNADALQVYQEIPIITAQPSKKDQLEIQHKLYSIIKCGEYFSVGMWLDLVYLEISNIITSGKIPIVVGGSGLYIKSLVDGLATIPAISEETKILVNQMVQELTPKQLHSELEKRDVQLATRLEINDIKRISRGLSVFEETKLPLSHWQQNTCGRFDRTKFSVIYLKPERSKLYQNCNDRFLAMTESGAIEEVRRLYLISPDTTYPKAMGLYEILSFIKDESSINEAIVRAQQSTRNYAKRQLTWFNNQVQYDLVVC